MAQDAHEVRRSAVDEAHRQLQERQWDFARALTKAGRTIRERARARKASQRTAVDRGRRQVELAVPALVDLVQALTLGTGPEELDRSRGGIRIMAELAVRQLAMAGLKTGEFQVEHDVSDRLKDALRILFKGEREGEGEESTRKRRVRGESGADGE